MAMTLGLVLSPCAHHTSAFTSRRVVAFFRCAHATQACVERQNQDMSAMVKQTAAYGELWNVNFNHGLDEVMANGVVADDGPGESTSVVSSSLFVKSELAMLQHPETEVSHLDELVKMGLAQTIGDHDLGEMCAYALPNKSAAMAL